MARRYGGRGQDIQGRTASTGLANLAITDLAGMVRAGKQLPLTGTSSSIEIWRLPTYCSRENKYAGVVSRHNPVGGPGFISFPPRAVYGPRGGGSRGLFDD